MATPQRIYPVGEQNFVNVRERNCIYVDKTELIYNLTHGSTNYVFLSRPRRFGKSLLISTMKEYFLGRKELFHGLAMEKLETEWAEHPVFVASFSQKKYFNVDLLNNRFTAMIGEWEKKYGKDETETDFADRFSGVVRRAVAQTGKKAVVLIDEYDSPLLDSNSDPELQKQLRNIMRNFFSPLKDLSECLRFLFLTGITKFSQLSIFSELNNLANISLEDEYAAICGITKEELLTQMRPDIELMAAANGETFEESCAHLRKMYDGYHFSEKSPDIYNPFSLVRAFNSKKYNSYWFESGTPTFLVELLQNFKFDVSKLEKMVARAEDFYQPTETIVDPLPVLYQSGYLTIKGYNPMLKAYELGYPNNEVRHGFLNMLLPHYAYKIERENNVYIWSIIEDLMAGKMEECMQNMRAFFSSIPYKLKNKTEKDFQTIFYMIFRLMGQYVRAEECMSAGRPDAVVWLPNGIFVFEFKYNKTAQEALNQINSKDYAIPFATDGRKIYKIGVNIDGKKRTIGDWIIEEA